MGRCRWYPRASARMDAQLKINLTLGTLRIQEDHEADWRSTRAAPRICKEG